MDNVVDTRDQDGVKALEYLVRMKGAESVAMTALEKDEVMDLFSNHVSSGKVNFFKTAGIDFVLGKREGPYLWDMAGEKKLIDCHCNGGVFNLGHRNPAIIEVLIQGLQELDIGNHHLISEQRASLAHMLAGTLPGEITYTIFGVSGGEAIDLAIKVARGYTGKATVISAKGGYHGHTGLALAAGDEKYRAPFGPTAPGFIQIPFDDISALEDGVDGETAAVLFELVPATSGIIVPSTHYFEEARRICDENDVLMIVDEIQTGLGRTGKLWGIEHFNVVPDILVVGKGLSGGLFPMTATCLKQKLETVFHDDPFIHVSTFGGAEVGCPVALKVLEISSSPEFLDHVNTIANEFTDGFVELRQKYPEVLIGLRQLGMMMGIEMVSEQCGPLFTRCAYENGFLSVFANNDPRVAQLLPPLTIDSSLVGEILDRVDLALKMIRDILYP